MGRQFILLPGILMLAVWFISCGKGDANVLRIQTRVKFSNPDLRIQTFESRPGLNHIGLSYTRARNAKNLSQLKIFSMYRWKNPDSEIPFAVMIQQFCAEEAQSCRFSGAV
jgi:hypothetical protein